MALNIAANRKGKVASSKDKEKTFFSELDRRESITDVEHTFIIIVSHRLFS
jgi:hypothetical protein